MVEDKKREIEFCLSQLAATEGLLRDLAFMIPTATGHDELYFATEDALTMRIDDLEKCMSKETHRELRKHFDKLTEFSWEAENASDVVHELSQMGEIACSGVRKKILSIV